MKIKEKLKIFNNDYVLNTAVKIINLFIGFITSMFCTRYLGVINKGTYSYISQIASTAAIIGNLGVYHSYSFNYKKYGKETLKKYSDICFLQFLFYFSVAIVIAVFSNDYRIRLAVLLIPFSVLKNQYENIVLIENIRLRMFLHVFDKILLTVSYALLFFTAESNVSYVVYLTIFVDVFTVAIYLIKLGYMPKIWHVDFTFLKSVLKFGWLPMLSLLLITLNYSVDIFFLEHMGIAEDLGYYSFAANIINYVWMLPDAFKEVLFSKSAKKLDRKNIGISVQISLISIACCLGGFFVIGKPLISLLYGSEFLPSYRIVLILIFGAFSMAVFKLLGTVLVSQGKRKMHFTTLAISVTINIIANILTIPRWGMYGAALASVLSYTACALIIIPYFCRLFDFKLNELFVPSKESIIQIKNMFFKIVKKQ